MNCICFSLLLSRGYQKTVNYTCGLQDMSVDHSILKGPQQVCAPLPTVVTHCLSHPFLSSVAVSLSHSLTEFHGITSQIN